MIHLVLRNLLSNAVKFTNIQGEIKISYELTNSFVTISIMDNGKGMTKEQLAKLFRTDSLFTLSGTANEKGTGLGLLLCKEFVEKNGGNIWVESTKGEGSKFYFSLPFEQEYEDEDFKNLS